MQAKSFDRVMPPGLYRTDYAADGNGGRIRQVNPRRPSVESLHWIGGSGTEVGMAKAAKDPLDAMRRKAAAFAGVAAGKACTQDSFKVGGRAFLFLGTQGGRCKAMFKLASSRPEAERLARDRPADFQVGSGPWVTARFSAEAPLPAALWTRWLAESHALAAGKGRGKG